MLKRSLNTFMNAWTGPDFTSYPFSSANEKDYYNLLDIYAEASLKPLLRKEDFQQEGWRYEFEDKEDPSSPLVYKGVVFNEMKGAFESHASLFYDHLMRELFRGTYYANQSGGDPVHITSLEYEDLKKFYERYYHPSNSSIFTYGDLNPLKHQKVLDSEFLSRYSPLTIPEDDSQPLLTSPRRITVKKPVSPTTIKEGKETTYAVCYLTGKLGENPEDQIGLDLLGYLLCKTPKSPFYIEFLESNIAGGYCPGVGFEDSLLHTSFILGFDNV